MALPRPGRGQSHSPPHKLTPMTADDALCVDSAGGQPTTLQATNSSISPTRIAEPATQQSGGVPQVEGQHACGKDDALDFVIGGDSWLKDVQLFDSWKADVPMWSECSAPLQAQGTVAQDRCQHGAESGRTRRIVLSHGLVKALQEIAAHGSAPESAQQGVNSSSRAMQQMSLQAKQAAARALALCGLQQRVEHA